MRFVPKRHIINVFVLYKYEQFSRMGNLQLKLLKISYAIGVHVPKLLKLNAVDCFTGQTALHV